ncbi:MAG: hypothetical protein IK078_01770 [Lachnospiraceae bacterium]|nr:hypothetical protein [Lachnospiraceae bacterium]
MGQYRDFSGIVTGNREELYERLESYLQTITQIRPYLQDTATVIRFDADVDKTYHVLNGKLFTKS